MIIMCLNTIFEPLNNVFTLLLISYSVRLHGIIPQITDICLSSLTPSSIPEPLPPPPAPPPFPFLPSLLSGVLHTELSLSVLRPGNRVNNSVRVRLRSGHYGDNNGENNDINCRNCNLYFYHNPHPHHSLII